MDERNNASTDPAEGTSPDGGKAIENDVVGVEPDQPQFIGNRYCPGCGSPLDGIDAVCVRCHASSDLSGGSPIDPRLSPAPFADVIGLYSIWLLTFLPMAIAAWTTEGDESANPNIQNFVLILDSFVVGIWALVRWRGIWPLLWRPPAARWFVGSFVGAVATFAIASVFVAFICGQWGVPEIRVTDSYRNFGFGFATIVLAVCVQPAVIEELAFRGIVFNGLLSILTVKETVIVSSLMFMIVHLTAFGLPQLVLGLVLAWMRVRSRSLWPGIVLHFTHNLLCVTQESWWS